MSVKDSDTVYVAIGRRSGKTMIQARQMEELMKSGKKVVIVEPKYTSRHIKGKPCFDDTIVDRDILSRERIERADRMLNMILNKSGDS